MIAELAFTCKAAKQAIKRRIVIFTDFHLHLTGREPGGPILSIISSRLDLPVR
jgi:hypothetical protein